MEFFAASLSEKTRKNYYNVIKAYIKITGHSPLELTESDTEKYFNDLTEKIQSKRLSYSTALMRMSVMRTLCEYIRVRENTPAEIILITLKIIYYLMKIK